MAKYKKPDTTARDLFPLDPMTYLVEPRFDSNGLIRELKVIYDDETVEMSNPRQPRQFLTIQTKVLLENVRPDANEEQD